VPPALRFGSLATETWSGRSSCPRSRGVGLIVVGLIIAGISLLADTVGVGAQPGIIGWKQLLGAGVGLVMLISGVVLQARERPAKKAG